MQGGHKNLGFGVGVGYRNKLTMLKYTSTYNCESSLFNNTRVTAFNFRSCNISLQHKSLY